MKKTAKVKPAFATMPKGYEDLCKIFLPRPIHDKGAYENVVEIADIFAGFEDSMSDDQADYFELLCDLIASYEESEAEADSETSPLETLKFLLEENGMSGADLSKILGASRLLGPMILRGDRKITASHAAALGKRFKVSPAVFIDEPSKSA